MEDKVEVLHKVDIEGGDPRWPVSVQVERRTTERDGKSKTYINLLVAVGQKRLFIPRRVSTDVAEAMKKLAGVANEEYTALLEVGGPRPEFRK
jgi:hypothetical protein